ncbi:hypothetical protein [Streptomyces sp. NPDC020681]|uniref:hypothetical protein n=1 Tax=Streptomyces sp. NPDC020681 TaxID=3365083 RepID=UPI0037A715EA
MRMRRVGRALMVAAAAIGATVFASGPASAYNNVNWNSPVNTNSLWKCHTTKKHGEYDVYFQPCLVFDGPGSTHAWPAVIVSNRDIGPVYIHATLNDNFTKDGRVGCNGSTLNSGREAVCFGQWGRIVICGRTTVYADLWVEFLQQRSTSKHHDYYPAGVC